MLSAEGLPWVELGAGPDRSDCRAQSSAHRPPVSTRDPERQLQFISLGGVGLTHIRFSNHMAKSGRGRREGVEKENVRKGQRSSRFITI